SLFPEGVTVSGSAARPWHFRGPLAGRSAVEVARKIDADFSSHVDSLGVFGCELGPIDLVCHWKNGVAQLEPVSGALGSGRLWAQPALEMDRDVSVLTLAPGRVLDHIAIDSKLCDLVLQYVNP